MKYTVAIEGMGCEMCVKKVNNALNALGAKDVTVKIGEAAFKFEGSENEIRTAVEDAGFDVVSVRAE